MTNNYGIGEREISRMNDDSANFESVYLKNDYPHCKRHGAMNRVSKNNPVYRCLELSCRSGCVFENPELLTQEG